MLSKDAVTQYLIPLFPISTHIKPIGDIEESLQCILFDIYGTLFISDSGDIINLHINSERLDMIDQLLAKYQIRKISHQILKDYIEAISKEQKKLKSMGIDFPEIQIDKIWMDITGRSNETVLDFATEFDLIINPIAPMPHLKQLITACRSSGLLMGVISNAQFYTEYLFHWFLDSPPEKLGFHRDLLFYSYISGHAKPSPFMFHQASKKLKEMGITEKSILYMGNDMRNDILPAKSVGFKTALFAGDARSLRLRNDEPGCKSLQPDIIVTDLIQLMNHINTDPF